MRGSPWPSAPTSPITTGNSYSASAALWAGAEAVRRLGFVPLDKKGK